MTLLAVILASLCGYSMCANILGFFPFPSFSHQVVYQAIWKELSVRGHKVTVVTPDPINDKSLINLTEIDVRFSYEYFKKFRVQEMVSKDLNPVHVFNEAMKLFDQIVESQLNDTRVKKLIADESQSFDLILIESIHPVLFALSWRFQAPMIAVFSLGLMANYHEIAGNPTHPVLYPEVFSDWHNKDMCLWQKVQSVFSYVLISVIYKFSIRPRADKIARKYFGEEVPPLEELEKNIHLFFTNTNPLIYTPRPTVPAIIELGQMHFKPLTHLPKDLQDILDGAKDGVIYFSLGTNVQSVFLDDRLSRVIKSALSELPFLILWKYESDTLIDKPENVIIRKWLPQQDVLAHPNIKAFVTQGGLQSIEEAISNEVAMVGMPFMADQPLNVQRIVDLGIGLSLNPNTVTKNELKNAIIEAATNEKYKHKIKEVKHILFDKPMTGLEKAVWWSEYVIRHKGAKHLRSPSADQSWIQYLLLDVILVLGVTLVVVIYSCYKVVQKIQQFWRPTKLKSS